MSKFDQVAYNKEYNSKKYKQLKFLLIFFITLV